MSKSRENFLFDTFQILSESDKNSVLDFVEYLSNRKITHQSERFSEREYLLKTMSEFLDVLPTETLRTQIWLFKGMELGMISQESNPERRDILSKKSIQKSLEINQMLKSFSSDEPKE